MVRASIKGAAPFAVLAGAGEGPPLLRLLAHVGRGEVVCRVRHGAQGETIGRLSLPDCVWSHDSAVQTSNPCQGVRYYTRTAAAAASSLLTALHGPW